MTEELLYRSTRGDIADVTSSIAILKGLAPDGGLYVPINIPKWDVNLEEYKDKSYQEIALEILKRYFVDFTEEELKDCIDKAYDDKFDTEDIVELKKEGDAYYLELFHGDTLAFKDIALSILPHLLTVAAKKNEVKNNIVVLTATSGDTGKAAMSGFADVEGTKIITFFPKDKVSKMQELQMRTSVGENVAAVAVHANFDDCQSAVKYILEDDKFNKEISYSGYQFSSANSINIGRLVPQIVYYYYSYILLLKRGQIANGDKINICVPTGNFGNILAGYYAKEMGLPINKFICASNDNNVLFEFFATGIYNRNRKFRTTISPSMDILISSNLERLLYHISGEDSRTILDLMGKLLYKGKYRISDKMKERLSDFVGGYATEPHIKKQIKKMFFEQGYVIDPHTAVASKVYDDYVFESKDNTPTVIASTASPFKFAKTVLESIEGSLDEDIRNKSEEELIEILAKVSKTPIPDSVVQSLEGEILHKRECALVGMKAEVLDVLGI
ncbi:MAG: threonine synthase [Lachnospiraceae bacterium]|jgi:threonine synthase|nr:threonine synthase [Lachnospiraceae bacterium]